MAHNDAIAATVSQVTTIAGLTLQAAYLDLLRVDKVEMATTARADWTTAISVWNSLRKNMGNSTEAWNKLILHFLETLLHYWTINYLSAQDCRTKSWFFAKRATIKNTNHCQKCNLLFTISPTKSQPQGVPELHIYQDSTNQCMLLYFKFSCILWLEQKIWAFSIHPGMWMNHAAQPCLWGYPLKI